MSKLYFPQERIGKEALEEAKKNLEQKPKVQNFKQVLYKKWGVDPSVFGPKLEEFLTENKINSLQLSRILQIDDRATIVEYEVLDHLINKIIKIAHHPKCRIKEHNGYFEMSNGHPIYFFQDSDASWWFTSREYIDAGFFQIDHPDCIKIFKNKLESFATELTEKFLLTDSLKK